MQFDDRLQTFVELDSERVLLISVMGVNAWTVDGIKEKIMMVDVATKSASSLLPPSQISPTSQYHS